MFEVCKKTFANCLFVSQLLTKSDVIAITETILNDAKSNGRFKVTEDESMHKNSPTKAGRVAFYAKKELSYTLLNRIQMK